MDPIDQTGPADTEVGLHDESMTPEHADGGIDAESTTSDVVRKHPYDGQGVWPAVRVVGLIALIVVAVFFIRWFDDGRIAQSEEASNTRSTENRVLRPRTSLRRRRRSGRPDVDDLQTAAEPSA